MKEVELRPTMHGLFMQRLCDATDDLIAKYKRVNQLALK